ncbi:hypothetical protein [Helicobacter sp. UBA3407]|uniref:hypothetical protein n=1 Tax=Helicobacter sp. UBA3407 TaxID=1946588 RepID=UPI0026333DB3|nr:hypothetical protein [Helicobacter sp. UBA3407]
MTKITDILHKIKKKGGGGGGRHEKPPPPPPPPPPPNLSLNSCSFNSLILLYYLK